MGETISILVRPDWSELGAKRFVELVEDKYYDNTALYRAVENFIVQFGLSADTGLREKWRMQHILGDPSLDIPFVKGIVSFAGSRKDTRETQIFITLGDYVSHLGEQPWETPFGMVVEGMEKFEKGLNYEYGEMPPHGKGPYQSVIWREGYEYLNRDFPRLTKFRTCSVI